MEIPQTQNQVNEKETIIESLKIAVFKAGEVVESAMKTAEITLSTTYKSVKDVKDNVVSMSLDLKSALDYLDSARRLIQQLEQVME